MRFELFGVRLEITSLTAIRSRRKVPVDKVPQKPTEEASDEFWRAFSMGGTLVASCRCGRTHFCSNTTLDYNEGELEDLLRKAKERPDLYVEDSFNDSVAVMDGPAGIIIWGCPCHAARPFEDFLREYRNPILDYYRRVTEQEAARLERNQEALAAATSGSEEKA